MATKKSKPAKKVAKKKSAAKKQSVKKSAKKIGSKSSVNLKAPVKKKKLANIKTKETSASVEGFLNKVSNEQQRKDSFVVVDMMKKASGEQPKMWGTAIIGFGNRIYESPATGRQVEWLKIGFSPRKAALTLYLTMNISEYAATLKKLGKHKIGGGCLYINKLSDVDLKVLQGLINDSMKGK